MNIPFFSFDGRNADIRQDALSTFERFFDSKWYVLGQETTNFECAYSNFNKTKHCIGVSTGLDAIHLALLACDVGAGDEVIVPSNTYIASVLAVTYVGAIPIFVEPRLETSNLNPELLEQAITPRTKAIMPVHLYGQACEMDEIMGIACKHKLLVIEDNAQSQGATFNGRLTGSFGTANATSFYPTKNIGAVGEAGAVTTDVEDIAKKVRVLRNYGSEKTYYNQVIGFNNRIDEFEAAFLSVSLDYFDKWTKQRQIIDTQYRESLSDIEGIEINQIAKGATTVNHLFTIRTDRRDELQMYLKENGIGTKIHYPVPPHLQVCYKNLGFKKGDFPIAEQIANTTLSLPNYLGLSNSEIDYISYMIKAFYAR